ncbi:hypothetical protein V8F33_012047 [Rhypophila sp. PSN 637]
MEYLGSILPQWPEFRDLYEVLSTPAAPGPDQGKVVLIDQLKDGRINARRFTNDLPRLGAALSQRPPGTNARVVILQYAEARTVSREFVDMVATRHHISPVILSSHFVDLDERGDASPYRPLRSETRAIEFGFYKFLHASILLLPDDEQSEFGSSDGHGSWTILILLRSSSRGCDSSAFELEQLSYRHDPNNASSSRLSLSSDISERYIACLQRETFHTGHMVDVRAAAAFRTPLDLIHPLCQLIALEIKDHMYRSSLGWKRDDIISLLDVPEAATRLRSLDYNFRASLYRLSMDMDLTALRESIAAITFPPDNNSYSHHLLPDPGMVSEMTTNTGGIWQCLRHDLQSLQSEAVRTRDEFEAYEARCLNRFNLAAAIESLEQSRSIGRLTILAFIFIPLSLMTSFFGMNIAEFGTGDIHIWVFVASTLSLLATTTVAWMLSGWIGGYFASLSSNFYGLRIRAKTLRTLASISPSAAFWLACFAISHPPRMFQNYLLDVGVWAVLGLGKEWDRPRFLDDEDELEKRWQGTLSPFWRRRAMEIVEMTKMRGWQRKG